MSFSYIFLEYFVKVLDRGLSFQYFYQENIYYRVRKCNILCSLSYLYKIITFNSRYNFHLNSPSISSTDLFSGFVFPHFWLVFQERNEKSRNQNWKDIILSKMDLILIMGSAYIFFFLSYLMSALAEFLRSPTGLSQLAR